MAERRPYTVCAPSPLQAIDDGIWTVDDYVPVIPGKSFPRKMTIVRLADGGLLFHNAIPLSDEGIAAVRAVGRPAFLFAPSPFHCVDADAFRKKLDIKVLCPALARAEIATRVDVDGDASLLPSDPAVRFTSLDGVRTGEGYFAVERAGKLTLVVCDVLLNVEHLGGGWGLLWRVLGFTGGPRVGPVWLKRAVADRRALKAHLEALAALPGLVRIIPSHGPPVEGNPGEVLRAIAAPVAK